MLYFIFIMLDEGARDFTDILSDDKRACPHQDAAKMSRTATNTFSRFAR